jgi:head-tail adaptor
MTRSHVATGLLNQRATLYRYAVTAGVNGVPVERYPEFGKRWCRLEPPTGREVTLGDRETHRIDAVLAFRSDVPIGARWLVAVGGSVYRVLAVLPRRMAGLVHVLAAWADDDAATVVAS